MAPLGSLITLCSHGRIPIHDALTTLSNDPETSQGSFYTNQRH